MRDSTCWTPILLISAVVRDGHTAPPPPSEPGADPEEGTFNPVLFYALSFAIAWTAWTPLLLHQLQGVELPVPYPVALFVCQTFGAFAPLLSLFVIQRFKGEPALVKGIFRKLRFRDVPVPWFIVPAVLPIAIAIASTGVYATFSSADHVGILRPGPLQELGWALVVVVPFSFFMGLIGSPLGEEPGWRGYVLDRLAGRGRGLLGSALVAVLWWVWHIPLFIVLDVAPNGYSFLEMAGHSLLIDSVFLASGGNLLVAMLYHQGVNTSFMFFTSRTQTPYGLLVLLGVAVTVRVFAGRRLKTARESGTVEPRGPTAG